MVRSLFALIVFVLVAASLISAVVAQPRTQETPWTKQENAVFDRIHKLRSLADDVRARETKQIAIDIRRLSTNAHKVDLAFALAGLSTEGDFGHDTLQEVANTLTEALRADPQPMMQDQPAPPYIELATLVRYEHVQTTLDGSQFKAALAKLEADDESRKNIDFTLTDVQGKQWGLKDLRGKVVLVNFWATWCGPCRKEMPDLETLYQQFKDKGFVILAVSDDEVPKIKQFLTEKRYTYPVLLDPGSKVSQMFRIDGIPKSFVYDREGKLVAQAIDMRTRRQFLEMLGEAGLH